MSRHVPFALTLLLALMGAGAQAQLDERTRSFFITQTKAGSSQNAGYIGTGVLVAVLDTGVLQTHPEFAGRLRLGKSFTGVGDPNVADDANGHGTHVAGIIAAARNYTSSGMVGMAYGATILPVKVLKKDGSGTTAMIDAGLRFATSKAAPIVNMSLGTSAAFTDTAFREAVTAGQLIVAAAGNSGLANPGWPARFAKESWANGQIIAVGAVDANNVIASFSNRAGDTAAFYVVAPGVAIPSTYLNNGYTKLSGTSMAAPVVTGAAAQIKGRWSHLSAAQIAELLFTTATDLGAPGTDAVYGRGLINVSAAMDPVGGLTTTAADGSSVDVLATDAEITPALAGLYGLGETGELQVVAFDAYRRDYAVDLGAVLKRKRISLAASLALADRRLRLTETVLADGTRLAFALDRPVQVGSGHGAGDPMRGDKLVGFSVARTGADGQQRFAGFGLADQAFGLQGSEPGRALAGVPGVADPYLALVPQAAYAGWGWPLAGGQLRAGLLGTALRASVLDQYGAASVDARDAKAATLEFQRPLAAGAVATLGWHRLQESGAMLGSHGQGALALGEAADTSSASAGLAWSPAAGWALGARLSWGRTGAQAQPSQLITGLSAQHTRGWGLAAVAGDRWHAGDRLSISLEQPLRTERGSLTFDAVQSLAEDGTPQRMQRTFSLVPTGQERRLELGYGRPLAVAGLGGARIAGWLDVALVLRVQPDHQADAPAESAAMLRWQTAF
jgi:hypothetical protein